MEPWLTADALSAPPGQEGQPTTSKDFAKHPKSREAGWWFKDSLSLNHHPVCAVIGGFAAFSQGAARPSWPGGADKARLSAKDQGGLKCGNSARIEDIVARPSLARWRENRTGRADRYPSQPRNRGRQDPACRREHPPEYPPGPTIDLQDYLILPGLINSHDHLEFNLFPRLGHGPYTRCGLGARHLSAGAFTAAGALCRSQNSPLMVGRRQESTVRRDYRLPPQSLRSRF